MHEELRRSLTPTILPDSHPVSHLLPTPFAAGGIGLILSISVPGGFTGGEGFAMGLLAGIALSLFAPAVTARSRRLVTRCPECGAAVSCDDPPRVSSPATLED